MPDTNNPLFDPDSLRIVQDLTEKFSLGGGQAPRSVEAFWRTMGAALQMAVPPGSPLEVARAVLERLGEDWDEDFADNDVPSLLAYETLAERVGSHESEDVDSEEDEDDDATGDLAREQQIIVVTHDAPIQTIFQWVEDGTLVLDPDWQRGYVWKGPKKRRFIESIFLNLPVPPVLLFQDKTGKMYVIDGRQRLETIWRYKLGAGDRRRSFTTFGGKTPGWREGELLHPAAGKRYDRLPADYQRKFNTFIIPSRVFHNLPRKKLYEVFKRYNTGGDKLRPAEIRNAVYQGNRLHEMIYRLAGEHVSDRFVDAAERNVANQLRVIMKGKHVRYGAYNFVGRFFAFAHMSSGSVAAAINEFMEAHGEGELGPLRELWLRSFNKTMEWYDAPLSVMSQQGKTVFHEWVATVQMVSTARMLDHIANGRAQEQAVREFVTREWPEFVGGRYDPALGTEIGGLLQDKQNATTHWERQRAWISRLETNCVAGLPGGR